MPTTPQPGSTDGEAQWPRTATPATVLIVEDEPAIAEAIAHLLRDDGFPAHRHA